MKEGKSFDKYFVQRGFLISFMVLASVNIAHSATHTYYIAAEDVLWDYAPSWPINPMMNKAFTEEQGVFVATNNDTRIGRKYWKGVYHEYEDETFNNRKARPKKWEHLGILGPVLRASVGDTIRIVFKNNTRDKIVTMHTHGLFYDKSSEGTLYSDGTSKEEKQDDAVKPGGTYTYVWKVPERAGPGPNDPSSIVWMYHSHVDEPMDTNAGLIGPIIITKADAAGPDGVPKDVDREFINLYTIFDENISLYLQQNVSEFAPNADTNDEDFQESNLMHAINGYVYSNTPGMTMTVGETIRWYLIGLGTEVDMHTPHWHGNVVDSNGHHTDVIELLPASMKTVTMVADNPGKWMYHCHVNDHITAGMMADYTVLPSE